MQFSSLFRCAALLLTAASIAAAQEKLLWSFNGKADGSGPCGGLVFDAHGTLFGVASLGGSYRGGTVFALRPKPDGAWSEETLYTFNPKGPDGNYPQGPLAIDSHGYLYGVNSVGGEYGGGTVFRLVPQTEGKWEEEILHAFNPSAGDGSWPLAAVNMDGKGNIYGTAAAGGAHQAGALFRLTPEPNGKWKESLYSFEKDEEDGDSPRGAMIADSEGNLYGTTMLGGAHGVGTVFKASVTSGGAWTVKVIHSFSDNGRDGNEPLAGVVLDRAGRLYGTTWLGGSHGSATSGGTVFELAEAKDGAWTETVLHDFDNNGVDGIYPITPVAMDEFGDLYGTASAGGNLGMMMGEAFELTPAANGTWSEKILHNFGATGMDGNGPMGGVIFDGLHNLYSTTFYGGTPGPDGSVFEIELTPATAMPEFSPAPHAYNSATFVSITDGMPKGEIYYTLNGEAPSTNSTRYTGPIRVSETETIRAIAVSPGRAASAIASAKFTIR